MNKLLLTALAGAIIAYGQTPEAHMSETDPPEKQTAASWQMFVSGTAELADYSYAGYAFGREAIPEVSGPVFTITDYGAKPNDEESDHEAIQAAIDAASVNGGVVYFPEGLFLTHTATDFYNDPIFIRGSNVVLRGAGRDSTVVMQVQPTTLKPAYGFWSFKTEPLRLDKKSRKIRVETDAYRGQSTLRLVANAPWSEGQWVQVSATLKEPNSISDHIFPYEPTKEHGLQKLARAGLKISEVHRLESVERNTVMFRDPMLIDIIRSTDNWRLQQLSMVTNVGVEDIEFRGNIPPGYTHHNGHDSTWSAFQLRFCGDCWIRRVRFRDVSRGMQVSGSSGVTVDDVIIEGRNGHYSVMIKGGKGVLVTNVNDLANQYHGPSISHGGVGHVYHRVSMQPDQSIDIHKTEPSRYNLYDMILGGRLDKSSGGGTPPRHLRGLTFWNFWNGLTEAHYSFKSNSLIDPNIIGLHGQPATVNLETVGLLDSVGEDVLPESLYEAQLARRLELEEKALGVADQSDDQ